jgi:hypothetical protein
MPLPEKRDDETRTEFIVRCMSDETMQQEFPERGQRLAVCVAQYGGEDKDAE